MSTAKFCDRYSSTLSGAYTSGGTSLSVTSAGSGDSTLPTGGDYFVKVLAEGANTEEVFKVTSRSGTTLTVVGAQAGTTASDHASGATIKGVILTGSSMRQARTDSVRSMTVSAFDALSGDEQFGAVHLSDGLYTAVWNGSGWDYYYGVHKCTPVVNGDYAWVNQSTSSVSDATKGLYLVGPSGGNAFSLRIRKKALASLPVTYVMGFMPLMPTGNGASTTAGMVLRESGTSKVATFFYNSTGGVGGNNATNETTGNTGLWNYSGAGPLGGAVAWLKWTIDSSNRTSYVSKDGFNWLQLDQRSRTANFTTAPDEIGFFVNPQNGAYECGITVISWVQS